MVRVSNKYLLDIQSIPRWISISDPQVTQAGAPREGVRDWRLSSGSVRPGFGKPHLEARALAGGPGRVGVDGTLHPVLLRGAGRAQPGRWFERGSRWCDPAVLGLHLLHPQVRRRGSGKHARPAGGSPAHSSSSSRSRCPSDAGLAPDGARRGETRGRLTGQLREPGGEGRLGRRRRLTDGQVEGGATLTRHARELARHPVHPRRHGIGGSWAGGGQREPHGSPTVPS